MIDRIPAIIVCLMVNIFGALMFKEKMFKYLYTFGCGMCVGAILIIVTAQIQGMWL